MRIEQLIGSYANNSKQSQARLQSLRPLRKRAAKGKVVDVVCISKDDIDEDFEWMCAYVRQIPADVVDEKIRQLFCRTSPTGRIDDEFLVEKLLFEVF